MPNNDDSQRAESGEVAKAKPSSGIAYSPSIPLLLRLQLLRQLVTAGKANK